MTAEPLTAEEGTWRRIHGSPEHRIQSLLCPVCFLLATLDRERAEHAALQEKARAVFVALDAIRDDETEDAYADALGALRAALDEVKG